ncbi:3-oxoacyl-[acyl-carrier-protein] reductase FabG [Planctomycetes bacterium Poly30]|uniref:3-oxoacyl-[acyl-carrier-protein] reductase FabG n=1 Tax=Saltatorellus ferox TaxID=2528018 RepID=A0A518EUF8_9BACT|nr:3-oxoacyl-[acyl-carrier-protein] reductase FabG [Planctomycetes bacterium Poly30]
MRFENQTVVVTGGTRGIGRAISLAFLAEGAIVHATYFGNDAAADALRVASGDAQERLLTPKFDAADHEAAAAFWETLADVPVSVLVANSGIRRDSILATMSPDDWDAVLRTNLTGGFTMSKFAVQNMMRQRYGRIIFTTSPAGRFGFEGQGNYSASKAGQVGLMRSLCKEVAKRKITVNCVSPGFIATELLDDLPEALVDSYKKSVPARRFGEPEEVAAAVLFLASKDAAYITGSTLDVTGGL